MNIYGAGLAGLITAHILRRHKPVVYEAQSVLPNNHEALLRFRTDAVSRATGIPFREVEVTKGIVLDGRTMSHPDIKSNNLYSYKVTGEYHARSISDLRPAKRYIAPPNFIEQLSRSVDVRYETPLTAVVLAGQAQGDSPVISTVPMPVMMDLAQRINKPEFKYKSIWSLWVEISDPCIDLYQTIYYPSIRVPYYRASITGRRVIVEYIAPPLPGSIKEELATILEDFGIASGKVKFSGQNVKEQKYGKLLPIDESHRRAFLLELTDQYRVYSIGRFATWRQILMDDVVKDIDRVATWIADRDNYQRRLDGGQ